MPDHSYPTNVIAAAADADPSAMLEPFGRRRFIQGVGVVAGASAFAATLPSGLVHAALPDGASRFVPLANATRLADTRSPNKHLPYNQAEANRIQVQVANVGDVPANASAVVLTVAAINRGEPNFVTVYPSGTPVPTASNLNLPRPGEINANLVTVKVGLNGSIDVFQRVACDVVVDILGYYEPVTGPVRGGRFIGLESARRAIDTRPDYAGTGSFTTVDLTGFVPADASSVVINLTATECSAPSYFTALAVDAPDVEPSTSSLNVLYPGDTRAASVIVPIPTIGGQRRIKIFTLTAAKLIVDVNGYYTNDTSPMSQVGLFVPVNPVRILDTRLPGQIGRLWPNWVVEAPVEGFLPDDVRTNASAVVCNVTGADSRGPGFLTVSAARLPIPGTSNVNWTTPGAYVPNHVITPITAVYGLQVLSSHGAHVIVDVAGYFTGTPRIAQLPPYVNPAPPAAPPPWVIRIPRLGLTSIVLDGDPVAVTNAGNSWHWTGTGFLGQEAHVAIFGHRTEYGGPYRYIHTIQGGDEFTVTTGEGREFTYRVVRRDLTDARTVNILAATRFHPGTTFSLIACTKTDFTPTSLNYRIVVTAELVSWREV